MKETSCGNLYVDRQDVETNPNTSRQWVYLEKPAIRKTEKEKTLTWGLPSFLYIVGLQTEIGLLRERADIHEWRTASGISEQPQAWSLEKCLVATSAMSSVIASLPPQISLVTHFISFEEKPPILIHAIFSIITHKWSCIDLYAMLLSFHHIIQQVNELRMMAPVLSSRSCHSAYLGSLPRLPISTPKQ